LGKRVASSHGGGRKSPGEGRKETGGIEPHPEGEAFGKKKKRKESATATGNSREGKAEEGAPLGWGKTNDSSTSKRATTEGGERGSQPLRIEGECQ